MTSSLPSIQALCAADLSKRLGDWYDYLTYEKGLSAHSIRAYINDMAAFISFMRDHIGAEISINDLSELTIRDFRSWISKLSQNGAQAVTRARSLSAVKNFFRWMDRQGIMHNPAIEVLNAPKLPQKLPKPLSERQARQVLDDAGLLVKDDWIGMRNRALFTLLYGAGLRIDEALSLTCRDKIEDGFLTVSGKGNKQRRIPVLHIIEKAIEQYQSLCPFPEDKDRYLFVGARGGKLNQGMAQKALRELRVSLGLPETTTPHALRHSFATHLLKNGANLREIQELLGHAALTTTQRYTEIDDSTLMKVYQNAHPRSGKK